MKQLIIVVQPFRSAQVVKAIAESDVIACFLRDARGYGPQSGKVDLYEGKEYARAFLPKVEILVWVSDDQARAVAERIVRAARTGRTGDGKILIVETSLDEPIEF